MRVAHYEDERQFKFPMSMDMDEVAEWLELGAIALGMPTAYTVQHEECMVYVDISDEPGKHMARFITTLIEREKETEKWKAMMDARKGTRKIDWDRVREPIATKGSRGTLIE